MSSPPPPATYAHGIRRPYASLPPDVQQWVADQLGGPIVRVTDAVGGFAPGAAAVVGTAERTAFCKVAGDRPNPTALEMYQGERLRLAALPDHPMIVKPEASDDLVADGVMYSVTLFPALPGRVPVHPWQESEAVRVFDALGQLIDFFVEASPTVVGLPDSDDLVAFFGHWSAIASDPDDDWRTDPWVSRRLEELTAADERVVRHARGKVAAHTDLRSDNILLEADGDRVWFVDWAAALKAAPWVDPALLACDLVVSRADRADGGSMDVWSFLSTHPTTATVERDLQWAMIAALAGTLHRFSRRPAPPGLPTIRAWQQQCAEDLLRFARRSAPFA